ncbi:MAG: transglutaminase-like domain-containing protein [Spirochaetota bacterium]
MPKQELETYLQPGQYVDSNAAEVIAYAQDTIGTSKTDIEKSQKLYYRIRDEFRYNPYQIDLSPGGFKASNLLQKNNGYCIEKASLLVACARSVNIPARLGFAIVENHIGTKKLEQILRSNKLVFHGYMEFYLQNKWVKATPAFDKKLCDKLGVHPLEFDGEEDSVFQEFSSSGDKFMEYLHDYGTFADFPYELAQQEFQKHYPHLFDTQGNSQYEKFLYFSGKAI